MCDPVTIAGAIVSTAVGAMNSQAQASDARQARNQAANDREADRKSAENAAVGGITASLMRNRKQRQTLLSGAASETLGGGQVVRPASRTLMGYGAAQPSMYSVA